MRSPEKYNSQFQLDIRNTESVKSKNSIARRKRGEKEEVGRVVLACKSAKKEQVRRALPPLHRNSDGKSCLDFLTFIIYRRAKCTFKVTPGYAFRARVYQSTFEKFSYFITLAISTTHLCKQPYHPLKISLNDETFHIPKFHETFAKLHIHGCACALMSGWGYII